MYGEPHTSLHRSAALLRYSLLPLWYSVFFEAFAAGLSVLRPLFMAFPDFPALSMNERQYMIGEVLMVSPITSSGVQTWSLSLPPETQRETRALWYSFDDYRPIYTYRETNFVHTLPSVSLSTIPVFIKSGTVFGRKMRVRRSASLMIHDPLTLIVAPRDREQDGMICIIFF